MLFTDRFINPLLLCTNGLFLQASIDKQMYFIQQAIKNTIRDTKCVY